MINPMPTSQFLDKFYSSTMFKGLCEGLLSMVRKTRKAMVTSHRSVEFLKFLVDKGLIRNRETAEVLDFGCAEGSFLLNLKRSFPRFRVYGVDPGAKVFGTQSDGLDGLYEDIESLPREQQFDVITLWHVLEHLREPLETISSLKTRLRPGGLLLIEVPDFAQHQSIRDFHIEHLYYFEPKTLRLVVENAGLEVVEVTDQFLQIPKSIKIVARRGA